MRLSSLIAGSCLAVLHSSPCAPWERAPTYSSCCCPCSSREQTSTKVRLSPCCHLGARARPGRNSPS
eukprot:4539941-Amphidinium_carterae.1